MRLPKTARECHQLPEIRLGNGDYAAGGARSTPFLDLDGARRRRPLVMGEIRTCLDGYPELAASMFSGRQTDPCEWAVMWKEIGADGVYLRVDDGFDGDAPELVMSVHRRTGLPVAVSADPKILSEIAEKVDDSVLILVGGPGGGCHMRTVPVGEDPSETEDPQTVALSVLDGSLGDMADGIWSYRSRGLRGDPLCARPIIADITPVWDSPVFGRDGFSAREASMWEGEAALSAMMSGADILFVRGPGAADMARVYGEELADL